MSYVEIKRIDCADNQGNKYIVIVRQKIISKAFAGVMQKNKGHIDFILADGRDVKMIGNDYNVFELFDDNQTRIKAI